MVRGIGLLGIAMMLSGCQTRDRDFLNYYLLKNPKRINKHNPDIAPLRKICFFDSLGLLKQLVVEAERVTNIMSQ